MEDISSLPMRWIPKNMACHDILIYNIYFHIIPQFEPEEKNWSLEKIIELKACQQRTKYLMMIKTAEN